MAKSFLRSTIKLGALFLIVDGVRGLLQPRRPSLLWHAGPEYVKAMTEELADHPRASRAFALTGVALGLALISKPLSPS
jgi:hypothetical protein